MTEKFLLRTFIRWGKRDLLHGFWKVSRVGNRADRPLGITYAELHKSRQKVLDCSIIPHEKTDDTTKNASNQKLLSTYIYKYYTTHILPPANFESSSNIAQVKTPYIHTHLQLPPFERNAKMAYVFIVRKTYPLNRTPCPCFSSLCYVKNTTCAHKVNRVRLKFYLAFAPQISEQKRSE